MEPTTSRAAHPPATVPRPETAALRPGAGASQPAGGVALGRLLGDWRGGGGTVCRQLAGALRALVRDGRVASGSRLPSERRLAADLAVSRTTVAAAYRLLRTSGHAESRPGSGTYAALPAPRAAAGTGVPEGVIDLVTAALPAPEPWFSAALDAAVRDLAGYARTHGCFPAGLPELREVVAARYTRRGVPTHPEQILVTGGATGALALLLRTLTGRYDRVAVESPGHPNLRRAVDAAGARPVPVAVREDGWDLPAWAAALRSANPRLACPTPDFQQPTGLLMPEEQRRALLALAVSAGVTLVVDETLAELPLTPQVTPPPPLAALDAEGAGNAGTTVITVGSAAKTLWAGLRVGWIRATPQLVRTLAARRVGVDLAPPVLEQLVACRLLDDSDAAADAVALQRARARSGRDALVAALRRDLTGWTFRVPDGGLALWVRAGGRPARELTAAAERRGVRLAAGSRFGTGDVHDGHLEGFLRVSFARPPEVLEEAVRRIARHGKGPVPA
ncbi:PLP-dependent aminotransferase family protein [Streptomyces sp. NPDC046759]|uniref:MocR-like transcription factor YczR n=1 Tax=Streptomyces sp. NPDC046759 TaxID=3155019 RepID=UPI0033DC83A1